MSPVVGDEVEMHPPKQSDEHKPSNAVTKEDAEKYGSKEKRGKDPVTTEINEKCIHT